jgi:hypothetical protein
MLIASLRIGKRLLERGDVVLVITRRTSASAAACWAMLKIEEYFCCRFFPFGMACSVRDYAWPYEPSDCLGVVHCEGLRCGRV